MNNVEYTFYPLSLEFPNGSKLTFQYTPKMNIEFIGDRPTQSEIVHVLSYSALPCVMVQVIEIIIDQQISLRD